MSLAKLKNKETKGKQKSHLPKLKAILANPIRKKCPTLDDDQMKYLHVIFKAAMLETQMDGRKFATHYKICMGLESSLRCINNKQSICVFLSLSIKPSHIVSLIVRNAEVKDPLQPIYALPNLEDFTEKIFGIRALCLVLTKDLKNVSDDLDKWVQEERIKRNFTQKAKQKRLVKITKTKKRKEAFALEKKAIDINPPKLMVNKDTKQENKTWSGDYISFDNVGIERNSIDIDPNNALNALAQTMSQMRNVAEPQQSIGPTAPTDINNVHENVAQEKDIDTENSNDFLDSYKELVVHKIKPNPNKKPKRQRSKTKNKNKIFKN